ncbi:sensor domain-containing diguanylate cyclase, partial [Flavobacterium poyangense]
HHKLQLANAHIYEMLAKRSGDIVFAADSYGKILFISPSIGEVLGVPLQTAEMRGWKNYVAKGDVKKIYKTAFRVIRTGKPVSVDFRIIDAKGREKILEAIVQTSSAGKATIVIGSMRDVTEQRRHERALSRLSETDPLTELPNRRAFDRYFRAEWNRSFAAKASMSILMIDV